MKIIKFNEFEDGYILKEYENEGNYDVIGCFKEPDFYTIVGNSDFFEYEGDDAGYFNTTLDFEAYVSNEEPASCPNGMNNLIIKVNNISSEEDMNDFKDWLNLANYGLHSNITYDEMYKIFGVPNFQDDYNESDWWILDYKGDRYAVDINSHEEGTWLHMYVEGSSDLSAIYTYKEISIKAKDFYDKLFQII